MSRGPWNKQETAEPPKPTDIIIPNCTYGVHGCRVPGGCESCGFDKREIERRKQLPLIIGTDGLARKIVGRQKNE